jgi:hypothetical protein
MLGPAELRELDEALAEESSEISRPDRRTPYLTPHFAMGIAMTRAVGEMKQHLMPLHYGKRR